MAVSADRVTAGAAAVALNGPESDSVSGCRLVVRNGSAVEAALGPAGVAAATGFRLAVGATLDVTLTAGEQLFAIRVTTDAVLDVIRTGV